MGAPAAPGVYNQTINLSAVPVISTGYTGATVFASNQGPVTPQFITTSQQFTQVYGIPNAQVSFGHYQALPYLDEGPLYCNRAVHSDATYAGLMLGEVSATSDNLIVNNSATPSAGLFTTVTSPTISNLAYLYLIGPGSYGNNNIGVSITSNNMLPVPTVTATLSTTGGTLSSGTYVYTVTAMNSIGEIIGTVSNSLTIASGSTNSINLSWANLANAVAYNVYGRTSGSTLFIGTATNGVSTSTFTDVGASITSTKAPPSVSATTPLFNVNVWNTAVSTNPQLLETWQCSLLPTINGLGQQTEMTSVINSQSAYIQCFNNGPVLGTVPLVYNVSTTNFSGASAGSAVTTADIVNAWSPFTNKQLYPVEYLFDGGYTVPAVALAIDAIAQARQDCIGIIAVPSNQQSVTNAVNYRNITLNMNTSYTGLFTPDILVPDNYNNINLYVPPAGAVAAQYAYTANNFFPWFAAAGLKRGLIPCLGLYQSYNMTTGDTAALHAAQVNPILNFPGQGYAIFDQVTLNGSYSALSLMNVRNLLNVCTKTIDAYLLGQTFDPNDDHLATAITSAAQMVLDYIFTNEGLAVRGLAYSNANNNTPYTMNLGQRILTLVMTPTYPAQQIILQSVLTAQGASYSAVVASLS